MGYKMMPGKGESARSTGNGMQMRGLVNPPSPLEAHDGTAHPPSEVQSTLGREGEFVNSKENSYAGGSNNITFDPKTGYKGGKVTVNRDDPGRPMMAGKEYKISDPRQRTLMTKDSLKLDRKYKMEARHANELSGITKPK